MRLELKLKMTRIYPKNDGIGSDLHLLELKFEKCISEIFIIDGKFEMMTLFF